MIYGTVHPEKTEGEDIIGQYVQFTKIYDEQVRLYGRTPKAISETIRICVEHGILKEYLESRKQAVVTMMMDLYDQDRILKTHIASEKRIAAEEAAEKAKKEAEKKAEREQERLITNMNKEGMPAEMISRVTGTTVEKIMDIIRKNELQSA